jgi:hypothetical protein
MDSNKLQREKDRLEESIELAWMGIDNAGELEVENPFDNRTKEEIENPHEYVLSLMRNPDYFWFTCKHVFNIELAPFQCVILKELWYRKYPMLIASRGGSKSFMLALYSMLRALLIQGSKIIVVGAAFRQAKVVFEYCETIWHSAPILRDIVGSDGRNGPRRDIDRCTCILGDSQIIALPLGDGTKIRGQRANVIIADEFASIPWEIYENVVSGFAAVAASPIAKVKEAARIKLLKSKGMWKPEYNDNYRNEGNQAILAGTAYYDFNHFSGYWKRYKTFIQSKGDTQKLQAIFGDKPIDPKFDWRHYSIIRMPYELLPEGFMDEAHVARSRATMHSGTYEMEFGAVFATDSNGFYKRSLIQACIANEENSIKINGETVIFKAMLRGDPRRQYIIGVDPASEQDRFSIVVLELNGNYRKIVFCWTTTRTSHKEKIKKGLVKEQDFYGYCARKIRELMKLFPTKQIVMDSQGGGIAIEEALHDPEKIEPNELPIWPIIDEEDEKDTDGKEGLHILEMIQFANAEYTRESNHGMRKDFEDKLLLFPEFDPSELAEALAEDKIYNRIYDTLEDCVMEIEELKDELATIVHTQTTTGRDHWDTPETKLAGNKKGRLRKDRYSALLIANATARRMAREAPPIEYKAIGGFAAEMRRVKQQGNLYIAPDWFQQKVKTCGTYGRSVRCKD